MTGSPLELRRQIATRTRRRDCWGLAVRTYGEILRRAGGSSGTVVRTEVCAASHNLRLHCVNLCTHRVTPVRWRWVPGYPSTSFMRRRPCRVGAGVGRYAPQLACRIVERTGMFDVMSGRQKIPRTVARAGGKKAATAPCRPVFDEVSASEHGHIDVYGHLQESAGWWLVGWLPRPFIAEAALALPAQLDTTQGVLDTTAVLTFYERPDLDQSRVGVVVYVPGGRRVGAALQRLRVLIDGATYGMQTTLSTSRSDDRALYDLVRPMLVFQASASASRAHLRALTSRVGYVGTDTLAALSAVVALEIDEALVCPPHGLVLRGWRLCASERVVAIRVRAGNRSTTIDFSQAIAVARPDVIAALGATYGAYDPAVGFLVYLPEAYAADESPYVEVELDSGERAYKAIALSRKQGLAAIRAVLEGLECRYADLDPMYDTVLGPAVQALNTQRLAQPFAVEAVAYGTAPANPSCSLVIPLYGRIDYLEYQIALLSADPASRTLDLIYVLDDPPQRHALLTLAAAVYARFRLPFRLLLSSSNRGFGPASNLGLQAAQAPYVAFVNSDVFPVTLGWTDRLIATLQKHPKLGAIGPRLLYEDGSVQHEGCYYQPLPEYGGWTFVEHTHKGRRPSAAAGLLVAEMITAACLLLPTKLARELRGFDEDYVIGDFEDADLCRRLYERKQTVGVDPSIVCHHLERQSQARLDGHWRMNLTLYNAWLHQRRWIAPVSAQRGTA